MPNVCVCVCMRVYFCPKTCLRGCWYRNDDERSKDSRRNMFRVRKTGFFCDGNGISVEAFDKERGEEKFCWKVGLERSMWKTYFR